MKAAKVISFVLAIVIVQANVLAKNVNGSVDIFDGQSLSGWHLLEKSENTKYISRAENFIVKNKALHALQSKDRKGALILSDKEYSDFELELDIKSDWGCDSGIFLRTNQYGAGIQILNDYLTSGNVGFVFGQGTGGYISRPIRLYDEQGSDNIIAKDIYDGEKIDGLKYAITAKNWNETWKSGDWNKLKIRIVGEQPFITTWVNGIKVMEFDGNTYQGRSLKHENKGEFDKPSAWKSEKIQRSGLIGFQVHPGGRWAKGGSAMYKNIKIKEL